jgi:L-ascorbate metabolism protein UlaG (beta-lactamase superfamily)
LGIAPPKVKGDLILVTHDHFDHNCARVVQGADSSIVTKPVMTVERGVRIEGIEAAHDTEGGARRGKVTIFRFELDGISFCHLGDLGHRLDEETTSRIASVDFLFVPVGDTFTIGPEAAREIIRNVNPKIAVPMHYRVPGLGISLQPVQNFLKDLDPTSVMKVGNEVEFALEDLPKTGTEIWVFSP